MRIGCLQFAPQVGDVDNNLNRADAVLSKSNVDELDLLVLPELAFTGYNFKSLQQIAPFLEPSGSGITSLWARTTALKYNAVVAAGYPEKVDITAKWPTGPEYYNSTILVNGDGETIGNYRKSFLYHTDKTWALEGPAGFYDGWIPGLGNTSIGICTDLNPYQFEAPWDAFEFAFHVLEVESNLVIVTMAWMTGEESRHFSRMPNEPDMETLTYWVTRLEPLIRSENEEEIIVIFCNRCGHEEEATYAGTSAVLGIQKGVVQVYGVLGRGQKQLLVVDTSAAPFARLEQNSDINSVENVLERHQNNFKSLHSQPLSNCKKDEVDGWCRDTMAAMPCNTPQANGNHTVLPVKPHHALKVTTTTPTALKPSQNEAEANNGTIPNPKPNPSIQPTAQGSTPTAVRPKLIIPQSPQTLPNYFSPGDPISALSTFSEQSIQSIKSNDSKLSIQTIRSNPRPPEDSTPYPMSGAPLSGYPTNGRKYIYGGYVSIQHTSNAENPATPFADLTTPISPQWYWRDSEDHATPMSASVWATGTPIGRQPQPFDWPILTAVPQSPKHLDKVEPEPPIQTPRETKVDVDEDVPLTSIERPEGDILETREKQTVTKGDPRKSVSRPSSPKSRNASRSRMHGRSDSMSQRDITPAITERLQNISRNARSLSNRRQSMIDVGSTRQRTPSVDRLRSQSQSRQSQLMAADESVYGDSHVPRTVATPFALDYYRQGSKFSQIAAKPVNSRVVEVANAPESLERTLSRGRQPGPRIPSQPGSVQRRRSNSADSTRNDVLHRRVSSKVSETHRPSPPRRASRSQVSQQGRVSAQQMANFERVEEILCPSCPVHGERSESAQATSRSTNDSRRSSRTRRRSETSRQRPQSRRQMATDDSHSVTTGYPTVHYYQVSSSRARLNMTPPPRSSTAPIPSDGFDPTNPTTPKAMTFEQRDEIRHKESLCLQPTTFNPNLPMRGFQLRRDNLQAPATA